MRPVTASHTVDIEVQKRLVMLIAIWFFLYMNDSNEERWVSLKRCYWRTANKD